MMIWLAALVIFVLVPASRPLRCLDHQGQEVDWYILYKLPMAKSAVTGDMVDEGRSYAYFTSETAQAGWQLSSLPIDDQASIPGRTLAPLYSKSRQRLAHVLYNDEHPGGNTSFTGGHTKGVVAFDEREGFWLIHSVPKYPPELTDHATYDYPHTGHRYGQSFLCVSFRTADSADIIGSLMMVNAPFVYSTFVPTWAQKYPRLVAASQRKHIRKPPFFAVASLKSLQGVDFTAFAKYTKFGKDLYADLVAPALRTNLLVESWPNGPGKMNSSCSNKFHVMNVDELDFRGIVDKKKHEVDFTTRHDHSKWAVSTNMAVHGQRLDVVCIGDINRMETQKKRGGGTMCFQNPAAWKSFTTLIKNIEVCPTAS